MVGERERNGVCETVVASEPRSAGLPLTAPAGHRCQGRGCGKSRVSGKILPLPDQGLRFPYLMTGNEIENQGRTTPENRRLGYARVSTVGADARQPA